MSPYIISIHILEWGREGLSYQLFLNFRASGSPTIVYFSTIKKNIPTGVMCPNRSRSNFGFHWKRAARSFIFNYFLNKLGGEDHFKNLLSKNNYLIWPLKNFRKPSWPGSLKTTVALRREHDGTLKEPSNPNVNPAMRVRISGKCRYLRIL